MGCVNIGTQQEARIRVHSRLTLSRPLLPNKPAIFAGTYPEGTNSKGEVGVRAYLGGGVPQRGELKVPSKYY